MKFAYADPPYLGCAQKLYGAHHPEAAKYDTVEAHHALIERLASEFPDGWAMSLHTPSLRTLLPLCPDDCRVAAWVKPFAIYKPGVNPAYAWEPVIWRGGRQPRSREEDTVRDWVSANVTLRKGLTGAKPIEFCLWILDLLGARNDDEFVDIFPGTGIMSVARDVAKYQQMRLIAEEHAVFQ